jgi:hypothetical protein
MSDEDTPGPSHQPLKMISAVSKCRILNTPSLIKKSKAAVISASTPVLETKNKVHKPLSKCPVCGIDVQPATLESHVNGCIDGGTHAQHTPVLDFETLRPKFLRSPAIAAELGLQLDKVHCVVCTKHLANFNVSSKSIHLHTCLASTLQDFSVDRDAELLKVLKWCTFCSQKWRKDKGERTKLMHLKSCVKKQQIGYELLTPLLMGAGRRDAREIVTAMLKDMGTGAVSANAKANNAKLVAGKKDLHVDMARAATEMDDARVTAKAAEESKYFAQALKATGKENGALLDTVDHHAPVASKGNCV